MKTKKQKRSERRIEDAKRRKRDQYQRFLCKVVTRRTGKQPHISFCCYPRSLGMSTAEFLGQGEKMAGGLYYFFPKGKLDEIVDPEWGCSCRREVYLLSAEYVKSLFDQAGHILSSNW